MEHSWSEVFEANDPQSKCDALYETLNKAINDHFLTRIVKLHPEDKPWMTEDIKRLIKERQNIFVAGNARWKLVRNKIIRKIAAAKKDFYKNKIQRLKKDNPAAWYGEIKLMTSGRARPRIRQLRLLRGLIPVMAIKLPTV